MKKPLTECRNEAERRENWPELCNFVDILERTGDPGKFLKAAAWILSQRQKEARTE